MTADETNLVIFTTSQKMWILVTKSALRISKLIYNKAMPLRQKLAKKKNVDFKNFIYDENFYIDGVLNIRHL